MLPHADKFFAYARERYGAMIRKNTKGNPPPWTQDPIIAKYRFCNVFREDDRTTRWIRENLRDPLTSDPRVIVAMTVARFINDIDTLAELKPHILASKHGWDAACKAALRRRREAGLKFITGAYMVRTPFGMDKVEGFDEIFAPLLAEYQLLAQGITPGATPLQWAHGMLMGYPYFGSFMAYEIVTDLRWTKLLGTPPDVMTWANAGPGAARGMSRAEFGELGHYRYGSAKDQVVLCQKMQELLDLTLHKHKGRFWPRQWPKWELRDVEHTLCEFDKYERVRLGEGEPKQLYVPHTV